MATSFPYLAIARQIGARYGDVLCFADSLDKRPDEFTASEWEARRRLDAASQLAITRVWADENARRRRVMEGIDQGNGSGEPDNGSIEPRPAGFIQNGTSESADAQVFHLGPLRF